MTSAIQKHRCRHENVSRQGHISTQYLRSSAWGFRQLLACVCICILTSCASFKTSIPAPKKPDIQQGDYAYVVDYLEWMIKKAQREHKISGLSIALVAEGKTIWQSGAGYASHQQRAVADASTLYRAGSIAKVVNSLAIMHFVEQGKVDIDTPIDQILNDFSINSRFNTTSPITLRNILSHQSGLPSDVVKGMWAKDVDDFASVLPFLQSTYVAEPPNTAYSYSNIGHDIVGLVIEELSGQGYVQFMQDFLIRLGMHGSQMTADPSTPRTAQGYHRGALKHELFLRDVPAAGLTTNVEDLATLVEVLCQQKLTDFNLSPSSIVAMQTNQLRQVDLALDKRVGLGLLFYDGVLRKDISVFGHGGAAVSHRAQIKFVPQYNIGVALLSNSSQSSNSLHRIADKAIALLYEAKSGNQAPLRPSFWPKPTMHDIVDDASLEGYYATKAGFVEIIAKRNSLWVKFGGRKFSLIRKQENGLLYLSYKLFGLIPIQLPYVANLGISLREINGRKVLVGTNTYGLSALVGEKIDPVSLSEAWIEKVGRYKLSNPLDVADIRAGGIRVRDGFLIAYAKIEHGEKIEVVLLPKNDTEAVVAGIGRGFGGTVHVVTDGTGSQQLHFSNMIFEKRD